jgi:pimeloyl-ACP methyl ester carboxylesterase
MAVETLRLPSGVTTVVERWGTSGPLILGVHGIGSSHRDFARLGEALGASHRVVAYDQRGHGDASSDGMALDALVEDLHAVARASGDVSLLVGHSGGGAVALRGGPAIARALLLVDPMIRVEPGTFDRDYVEDLETLLAAPPGEAREAAIREAFASADPVDREGKVHAMHVLSPETIRRLGRDNRVDAGGWDLRDALARLTIPTTILVAGDESVIHPGDLAGAAPSVRTETFAEHGHTLHRSAFPRFVELVREAADAAPAR